MTLDRSERGRLLALALRGGSPSAFSMDWILGRFDDLSSPAVAEAVVDFMARVDQVEDGHSSQHLMSSVCAAVRLLARADLPIPPPRSATPTAWQAYVGLVYELWRRDAEIPHRVADAWGALIDGHGAVVADVLARQYMSTWLSDENDARLQEMILSTIPPEGIAALVWALEHPDRHEPCFRFQLDQLCEHTMVLLGRVGDRQTAEFMRRFANDPRAGAAAVDAIRAIETRLL